MLVALGMALVVASVLGGYMAMGGKLAVLNQPFEVVIIFGSGMSAFIIGNPPKVLKESFAALAQMFKGSKYSREHFAELLCLQYRVYRILQQNGALELEQELADPSNSNLFKAFPKVAKDHEAMHFLTDYLRMITMGTDNPFEVETLMEQELEVHHRETHAVTHALAVLGESFPALGIVAAVLGVIKTMGAISEPPEVLGGLIGAALVGTFLGILLSYGWFSPFAQAVKHIKDEEATYLQCLRSGILAHLRGYAPIVSTEFARKSIPTHLRPSFEEVEEMVSTL